MRLLIIKNVIDQLKTAGYEAERTFDYIKINNPFNEIKKTSND